MDTFWQEDALKVTRSFKDTVFRDLFGSEDRKEYTLSLYNALRGTSYDDPNLLEITTIDNVIYLGMKHDISFLIGDELNLWEHQSTYNPNMPLRGLVYFAQLYVQWIQNSGLDIYGKKLINLPRPQYIVFSTGIDDRPDRELMRLSDAFDEDDAGLIDGSPLEAVALVININEGKNKELADACDALAGYAHFLALVRVARENESSLGQAVDVAIKQCMEDGYLVDYLQKRRAEVKELLLTEFNQELHDRTLRDEGVEEGRSQERARTIGYTAKAVSAGCMTLDVAAALYCLTDAEVDEVRKMVEVEASGEGHRRS